MVEGDSVRCSKQPVQGKPVAAREAGSAACNGEGEASPQESGPEEGPGRSGVAITMVVVDEEMTKMDAGATPRASERGMGEGQSLAAEPMEDAAGKASSDNGYEEGEGPVWDHNVMFGVGDAKSDAAAGGGQDTGVQGNCGWRRAVI